MPDMARYDPFSSELGHPFIDSSPDIGPRNGSFRTRPIGDMTSNMSFRERNKRLRNLDDEKNQLIEDLLYQLESTQSQLEQLQLDHTRETHYNRDAQLRENQLQESLHQVKSIMDRDPYILVLIDGDATLFKNDIIVKGETGGKEAATALSEALQNGISQRFPHLIEPRIIVRICANLSSISESMTKEKTLSNKTTLYDFIRGFNQTKALFDFVDAGASKDTTYESVREYFQMNLYNCHCHQIILGCAQTSRYAQLLKEAIADTSLLSHITLLESVPLEKDFSELKGSLNIVRFDSIFKNSAPFKVPLKAVQPTLPALARVESNASGGTKSGSSTPGITWAALTAQPYAATNGTPREETPTSNTTPEPVAANPAVKAISGMDRNRLGQRVDKVDSSIPPYEIQRIKKLKLCNIYHLKGPEYCTSSGCAHSHDYKLDKYDKRVLREVARMTPCYHKLDCDDPECLWGHRCPQSKPNENSCWYGEACKFYGWGHGIDTRVVKTSKV